jgi:hypothetical protein
VCRRWLPGGDEHHRDEEVEGDEATERPRAALAPAVGVSEDGNRDVRSEWIQRSDALGGEDVADQMKRDPDTDGSQYPAAMGDRGEDGAASEDGREPEADATVRLGQHPERESC